MCFGLARSRGNSTSIAFSGKIYTYTDFINILYSFISNIFFLCLTLDVIFCCEVLILFLWNSYNVNQARSYNCQDSEREKKMCCTCCLVVLLTNHCVWWEKKLIFFYFPFCHQVPAWNDNRILWYYFLLR